MKENQDWNLFSYIPKIGLCLKLSKINHLSRGLSGVLILKQQILQRWLWGVDMLPWCSVRSKNGLIMKDFSETTFHQSMAAYMYTPVDQLKRAYVVQDTTSFEDAAKTRIISMQTVTREENDHEQASDVQTFETDLRNVIDNLNDSWCLVCSVAFKPVHKLWRKNSFLR